MSSVTERLVLAAFDNPKRELTEAGDLILGYALCGALLTDLALQDFLEVDAKSFRVNTDSEPEVKYLKEVHSILKKLGDEDRVALFRNLYSLTYKIKPMVLEHLVKQGVLSVEEKKLKWAFDVHKYTLKKDQVGIRQKLFSSLNKDQLSFSDFCVVQLIATTGLLNDSLEEKQQAKLKRRLDTLNRLINLSQSIAELMDQVVPQSISESHKVGQIEKKKSYSSTWEWRGFWFEDEGPSILQASLAYRKPKEEFEFSEYEDTYLMVGDGQDNIKVRKSGLEVKRPIESYNGYTAFYPKQSYKFPFKSDEVVEIFPRLFGADKTIESLECLYDILQEYDYDVRVVEFRKKRYQVKLEKQVKLEFSTVFAGKDKFLTVCVEGPDYHLTHAYVQNLSGSKAKVRSYSAFIREFLGDYNESSLIKDAKERKKSKKKKDKEKVKN